MPTDHDEPTLRDFVSIARRRFRWIALTTIAVTALGAGVSLGQTAEYRASARVLLSNSAAQDALQSGVQNPNLLSRELSNEISLANGDDVRRLVAETLGDVQTIAIRSDASSDVLIFTAADATPEAAALVANTWADAYVTVKQTQAADSIGAAVDRLGDRLTELRGERALTNDDVQQTLIDGEIAAVSSAVTELQLQGEIAALGTARVIQVAAEPTTSTNSPLSRNLALAGAAGLLLGVVLAQVVESLDRTIKNADDLPPSIDLPVLGTIPKPLRRETDEPALAVAQHPEAAIADAYLKVRTALEFAMLSRPAHTLMVTSASESEGKTTTACNLAWAMASSGRRVVLADVDFRRPRIHTVFGVGERPGMTDHVLHRIPLDEAVLHVQHAGLELAILPAGLLPPSPSDFLSSPPFLDLVRSVERESDLIVMDTPPVLPVSDALTLARHVDATIVVVKCGQTTKDELATAIESLHRAGAAVVGLVLVGVDHPNGYRSYGYRATGAAAALPSTPPSPVEVAARPAGKGPTR